MLKFLPVFILSDEPRVNINQAFKQDGIYAKHSELLKRLGCAHHLQQAGVMPQDEKIKFPLITEERLKELKKMKEDAGGFFYQCLCGTAEEQWLRKYIFGGITEQEFLLANDPDQFKKDCLAQLEWERRKARWEPIQKSIKKSSFALAVAWITSSFGDPKSEAIKKTQQIGIGSALYGLQEGVESIPSLIWPSDNPFKELEERFAENKCFIPPVLWPKIIKAFTYARDDTMNRQKHIDFLHFALDLTVYKPKPDLQLSGNRSVKDVKKELETRIDDFFKDYPQDRQVTATIKLNVAKFIDSLTSQSAPAPSYLYLHGSGGIGKTHFVQTLAQWLDELTVQAVSFESLVINDSNDLEGNRESPGAFVKVLRNQLAQGKRGSVVFIDEACWLNNASMCSTIKRTFNGNRTQLSVACFGSGIDGAVKIEAKVPMLIILAGNASNIEDKALATRIKNFFFPSPDKSALVKKALQVALQSNYLQEQGCEINEAIIAAWIKNLPLQNCNFRYIENNVEEYILELMENDKKR